MLVLWREGYCRLPTFKLSPSMYIIIVRQSILILNLVIELVDRIDCIYTCETRLYDVRCSRRLWSRSLRIWLRPSRTPPRRQMRGLDWIRLSLVSGISAERSIHSKWRLVITMFELLFRSLSFHQISRRRTWLTHKSTCSVVGGGRWSSACREFTTCCHVVALWCWQVVL